MKRHFSILALFPLLLAFQSCDFMPIGGGGTGGEGLTGIIVDLAGAPVAGATVRVYPVESALEKTAASPLEPIPDSTTSDSDGTFEFSNLAAGRYDLEAKVRYGDTVLVLFRRITFLKSLALGTDTLRIAGGLRAWIQTRDGVPVVGAACSIVDGPWNTISDSSGACEFSGLMPGAYRLRVASSGLIAAEMDVVVVSGEIVEVGAVGLYSEADAAWTIRYRPAALHYVNSVAWSGSLFVAVGSRLFNGLTVTSPDGINWTQQAGTTLSMDKVVWIGNRFLAMSGRGSVWISPDGIEWTQHILPNTTSLLNGVAWSGTNIVIVGGEITLTSPDGTNWTAHEQTQGLVSVIWAGTQFVAVDNSSSVYTSQDGAVWTAREVRAGSHIRGVAWGNGQMVAVGSPGLLTDGPGILTSTDGINWVQRASSTVGGDDVEWVNGRFIVDGRLWSEDGVVWQEEGHTWQYWGRVWTGTRMISISNEGIFTSP